MPETWTEDDVARFLRIKPDAVKKLRQTTDGPPYFKFGRNVRYVPGKVAAWCETRTQNSTQARG